MTLLSTKEYWLGLILQLAALRLYMLYFNKASLQDIISVES